jgi:hypothetical protein
MWRSEFRQGVGLLPGSLRQKSQCFATLTMIKKALPSAFPSMRQDDRIAVQLADVLWTIVWKTQGQPGAFLWNGCPAGLAGRPFRRRLTVSGVVWPEAAIHSG